MKRLILLIQFQVLTCFCLLAQSYRVTYESFANNDDRLELSKQFVGSEAEALLALQYVHFGSELLYENGISSWYFTGVNTYPADCEINQLDFEKNKSIVYKEHKLDQTTHVNQLYEGICKVHQTNLGDLFEIKPETKVVNGYLTQRAVLKTNEEIDAWFSTQIEIPDGPFNVSGLPGLVLEYNDKGITYRMVKIEKIPLGTQLSLPKPDCKRVMDTREFNQHRKNSRG